MVDKVLGTNNIIGFGGARLLLAGIALIFLAWQACLAIAPFNLNLGNIELVKAIADSGFERPRHIERAFFFFHQAESQMPTVGTYLGLARIAALQQDRRALVEALRQAERYAILQPQSSFILASLYREAGDLDRAMFWYRNAYGGMSIGQQTVVISNLCPEIGVSSCIEEFDRLLSIQSVSTADEVAICLGASLVLRFQAAPAAEAYARRGIANAPSIATLHASLAWTILAQGRPEEAIVEAEEAFRLGDTDARTYEVLGSAYLYAGLYDEAVPILEQAVGMLPLDAWPRLNLGRAYWEVGQRDRAIVEWKELLDMYPDFQLVRQALIEAGVTPK